MCFSAGYGVTFPFSRKNKIQNKTENKLDKNYKQAQQISNTKARVSIQSEER
jgi:hypothetical protein